MEDDGLLDELQEELGSDYSPQLRLAAGMLSGDPQSHRQPRRTAKGARRPAAGATRKDFLAKMVVTHSCPEGIS